ncbi:MAG: SPASM domain-containing protein, partial [Deltaproteobacteria bacterium]|nr:SPASM domain-containing protein [Deltaproteobacteria bacterium]
QQIVGNVKEDAIRNIWQNHRMKEIRELHRRGSFQAINICANCTAR